MSIIVLLLSLLMGLSFVIGLIVSKKINAKWMTYFVTALAFVVILTVLITDIIPNIIKLSNTYTTIWLAVVGELIGITILFTIDLFIPKHHHNHKHNDDNKTEHKDHLYHIGYLTFISVVMHNLLEGIAFYLIASGSIKAGLLMAGSIALHNIPLGVEMSTFFEKSKKQDIIKLIILVLSGTIGALMGLIVGDLNNIIKIIVLSITCGMMLYLAFIELGIETFAERKEKGILEGLLVGAIIFALILL